MAEYSTQDLKYAAEFREEVHREALAIVRETCPHVNEVVDRHPVEDYFQEHWDYPGKWYTVVAIPAGYKSRKALVERIAYDTLSEQGPWVKSGIVVDYRIVSGNLKKGLESHRNALKTAFIDLDGDWDGDPEKATGKKILVSTLFSTDPKPRKLTYRKAFLDPPHPAGYTESDFMRVNEALFPNGTGKLDIVEWSTDWSDYFDDGHEWWGTLCVTVFDKTMGRFVVIMASATD